MLQIVGSFTALLGVFILSLPVPLLISKCGSHDDNYVFMFPTCVPGSPPTTETGSGSRR